MLQMKKNGCLKESVRSSMKLLYAHVGLKDISPSLYCLHSLQKLTPWSLTWSVSVGPLQVSNHSANTESERKEHTHLYLGESVTSIAPAEAFDHRNNPVTVQHYCTIYSVCITHMWQLDAHFCRHRRPGCGIRACLQKSRTCVSRGESGYLNLIRYSVVQTII